MISPQDTIAAIATPLGEGGLGVIRLSGTEAISVTTRIFCSAKIKDLSEVASHTCHFGTIYEPSPQPSPEKGEGAMVDEVIVTVFRAPHSYTGEDVIEISAHGSPLSLQKILALCLQKGARLAGPGEFTERAFLNGKMDLTQAEAVAELIHAKSDKSHAAALAQLQGGLASRVRGLRDQLLTLLAHVEVGLDHSDEDHDFLSQGPLAEKCGAVQREIKAILDSTRVSKILREGFRVSLVGRPNVGKSSLMNALLKEDRAIVTATPGTTRDTLEETLHLHGLPVVLTDTAGLRRDSQDPIEQLGMDRTLKSLQAADIVIGLFDGSEDLAPEDAEVVRQAMTKPHLWVITKSDLPQRFSLDSLHTLNGGAPVVKLSAKTGAGLEALVQTITGLALHEKAQASEVQWLLNARHQAALARAQEALAHAAQAAQKDTFEECVAMELQTALQALGEIIGETTTEELLGHIFSQFCVGK